MVAGSKFLECLECNELTAEFVQAPRYSENSRAQCSNPSCAKVRAFDLFRNSTKRAAMPLLQQVLIVRVWFGFSSWLPRLLFFMFSLVVFRV